MTSTGPPGAPAGEGNVLRVLDLPTNCLPEHLGGDGQLNGIDGVTAHAMPYGWLLWVPDDPDEHASEYGGIPEEVLQVQRYARALDCSYVLLDRDAKRGDVALKTWDW